MPAGVFKETYRSDMAHLRYPIHYAGLIIGLILAFSAPLYLKGYYLSQAIVFMIFLVAAVGLNITLGLAGLVSLAHGALMGAGAYTVALLASRLGLNTLLVLPLAGLAAAGLGFILSLPSFKLKGYYLAMASLAAQFILEYIYSFLAPEQYISMPFETKEINGVFFGEGVPLYYLGLVVTLILLVVAANIGRGSLGRAMKAVRDNDVAAEIVGINVTRTKALAFTIGGFYAGIAGGLYAIYSSGIGWEGFTLLTSIELLGMVLIGGPGRIVWGSILGVLLLKTGWTNLESYLSPWLISAGLDIIASSAKYIVLGVLIASFIIIEPEGFIAILRRIKEYLRLWPYSY
ncbi:MAG: branched-chain amino acid ABC transporter permease [Desulfurococcales archaeon]|nr:branched-chain amino acid ABC transporter permease [Desulfurococcales archaeon]